MSRPACEDVSTVGIIGGGTIGASWAAYFLSRGIKVLLVEPNRESAAVHDDITTMGRSLKEAGGEAGPNTHRLRITPKIDSEMAAVDFVQECGPERLAIKRAIIAQLDDQIAADVVVASSTSALMATDLQSECRHPQRILVGHPFNPPHLLPLVEVVAGSQTADDVVAWTMAFYTHVGKFAVHVKKEAVGHIANRLTAALFREALYMVDEGIASVADIDAVMTQGPGLRWAVMGPFLTYHLAGGKGGIGHYLEHLGPTQEARWRTLGTPNLSPELAAAIVQDVLNMIGPQSTTDLVQHRDEALVRLLSLV